MTLQSVLLRVVRLVPPGRAFADDEWRTLARAAEVLLPSGGVPPEDVADNVERFLVRGRSRRAWRVRILMHLIELLPLTAYGKPFSRMSVGERRRMMEERYVDGNGLWGLCAKVRYLVLMGAYGDARMHVPTAFVPVRERRRFLRRDNGGGQPAVTS